MTEQQPHDEQHQEESPSPAFLEGFAEGQRIRRIYEATQTVLDKKQETDSKGRRRQV